MIGRNKTIVVILLFILLFAGFKIVDGSTYLHRTDRLNMVFYSSKTTFYSFGFGDVDYYAEFPTNAEVLVPGGYQYYRIGALGKIVSLQKDPRLIQKTFSSALSTYVDLYFFPKNPDIYYTSQQSNFIRLPSWKEIVFDDSNANVLDRILVLLYFIRQQGIQYTRISVDYLKSEGNEAIFDRETFFKHYQGYFYKQTYRNEKLHVQILYTKSYGTAELLSDILEGQGIQVVDISQTSNPMQQCAIIYSKDDKKNTRTVRDLQRDLHCSVKKGTTDISDIILMLGNLEKEWGIN